MTKLKTILINIVTDIIFFLCLICLSIVFFFLKQSHDQQISIQHCSNINNVLINFLYNFLILKNEFNITRTIIKFFFCFVFIFIFQHLRFY